jgi:dipeptidyl aminopeptidase/acylaminoacyl peptidase
MKPRILMCCLLVSLSLASVLPAQNANPPAAGKASASASGRRNLTIADYFELQDVEDPQMSPEGTWVAYTVNRRDLKEDKGEEQIWMAPTAGGAAIPLTAKNVSSSHPRWSPDQKYLAFLSARGEGKKQVWLLYRSGGEAQQLTETPQDVRDFAWSPRGDKLVLVLQDPTAEELAAKEKKEDKSSPKTPPPWVIDRLHFKVDEIGYLDRRRTHLYVFDLASKKMTQVTSGDFDDTEPAWSPDGRALAFTSNRTENADGNFNTDIWVVATDNSDQGKALVKVTSNPGADHSPAWSPDGKWIACVSQIDAQALDYATQHLSVIPASGGGEARVLTLKIDRNVIGPQFSGDGKWIYFVLEEDGAQHLARIPASGGEVERPIDGRRSVQAFSLAKDGRVAAAVSEPHLPEEVFLLAGTKLRRLTTANDALMAQIQLSDVDYVHFQSKDGTPVASYLFKPPDYKAGMRYPTVLWIHGGPVEQYDAEFNFRSQILAANGYVVLNVNPRGSSGYGQKFSQAIFADWGNKDYEDVMAGVDYAIAQGIADPQRLGVGGWSYGGILTNNVITKTDRFSAAISGASEFLYVSNWGHDQYVKDWELELGLPWKTRALWEKLSPFNYVENIVTPTLVIGGQEDWNVPINNSEQLYQSLKRLGRTTQLVVYPGEFHEFTKPSYLKDRFERYLAWYAQYVKGETPQASPTKPAN